jgi:aryl-alcohol dehydrogenase-like predicted oxidoreductase
MATASLRWILDHPAVTTIIPGATRPEQVRANAGASDVPPLAGELHRQLRAFWQQRVRPHVRGND